eukprot:TRINITY_DN1159_c0_g1_i2.p1 TRINITY_DN1159_c0_g1~~TRINITY_DN1159_c0_g1_i2.p1  ORF type:complete len:652 (-),score=153.07 TRINITY_DN1159_c0_g1_i2:137-2092(-)
MQSNFASAVHPFSPTTALPAPGGSAVEAPPGAPMAAWGPMPASGFGVSCGPRIPASMLVAGPGEHQAREAGLQGSLHQLREHLDRRLDQLASQAEQARIERHEQRGVLEECLRALGQLTASQRQGLPESDIRMDEPNAEEEPLGASGARMEPPAPLSVVPMPRPPGVDDITSKQDAATSECGSGDAGTATPMDIVSAVLGADERRPSSNSLTGNGKPIGRSGGRDQDNNDEEWVDGESSCNNCYRAFQRMVWNAKFEYVMGVFILLNTAFIGLQIDMKANSLLSNGNILDHTQSEPTWVRSLETVFAGIFFVELVARIVANPCRFYYTRRIGELAWNLFDTVVVISSATEEVIKYGVGDDTIAGKLSVLRIIRIVKILRTLRIIRVVKAFRELRIVLMSMFSCLRQLFWTLLLLGILIYMVALVFLAELTSSNIYAFDASDTLGLRRVTYFSGLPRSVLTVFQCSTFGVLWDQPGEALVPFIPYVWLILALYMGFVVFAFGNTVTGIFVDQAVKSSQEDLRNVMLEEHEEQAAMLTTLRAKFVQAADGHSYVTAKKMKKVCEDEQVRMYFKRYDVDIRDVATFFDLVSGSRGISLSDVDAFIGSTLRLKGIAKNVDVVALTYTYKSLMRNVGDTAATRLQQQQQPQQAPRR